MVLFFQRTLLPITQEHWVKFINSFTDDVGKLIIVFKLEDGEENNDFNEKV